MKLSFLKKKVGKKIMNLFSLEKRVGSENRSGVRQALRFFMGQQEKVYGKGLDFQLLEGFIIK